MVVEKWGRRGRRWGKRRQKNEKWSLWTWVLQALNPASYSHGLVEHEIFQKHYQLSSSAPQQPPPPLLPLKFCKWEKLYDAMKIKIVIDSQETCVSVTTNLAGHLTPPTFRFQTRRSKSWPWCFQSSFYLCLIWNTVLEKPLVWSLRASERQSQARSKVSWGIIKIFIASSGWSGLWGCLFHGLMQAPISLSCPMFLQTSLQFCPVFKFSLADQVSLYKIS